MSQCNIEILYILAFQILSRFSAKFLVLSRFSHFLGQIPGYFWTWTDKIQISRFSRFHWEPCIIHFDMIFTQYFKQDVFYLFPTLHPHQAQNIDRCVMFRWLYPTVACITQISGWYILSNNLWCITLVRNYFLSWPILIIISHWCVCVLDFK